MKEVALTYLSFHLAVGIPFTAWTMWSIRDAYLPPSSVGDVFKWVLASVLMVILWPLLAMAIVSDVTSNMRREK